MSTRLVILGLLRDAPLYGYELKQIIEQNMGDWTNVAFGSIYFALRKLAEQDYVEKVATEQAGNRPSRSVYQITDAGHEEFKRLLREAWTDMERQYYTIDIAFAFLDALPKAEVLAYLQQRVMMLESALAHIEEHRGETMTRENVPASAEAVFEHSLLHLQAELTWSRNCLERLQSDINSTEAET